MAGEISGGGEVRVNTATQFDQISGKGAALAAGGFVVVWSDNSTTGGATGDASGGSVKLQLFDAAGNKVGTEILANTATASSQSVAGVTALANGGFVVTWEDYSGGVGGTPGDSDQAAVKAQVFTATGMKVGVEILVNSNPAGDQIAQAPVALTGGGFVVPWTTFNGSTGESVNLRAEVFAADGTRVATGLVVDDGANDDSTIIALDGNRFAVLWTDIISPTSSSIGDRDVRIRIYEGNGNPVGDSLQVNAPSSAWQNFDSVAKIAGGGFVVTWEAQNADFTSSTIMAQRFGASGAKIGVEFPVSATTTGFRGQSEVTQAGNGGFVVSWTYQASSNNNEVRAQLFDAAGAKIGGEINVNTATAVNQQNARLVSLPGGGFAAIWDDTSQGVGGATGDNNGRAIKGQLFDSAGTPVGAEFLVNVAIRERQQITDVVALQDGRFAVIWDDASQGLGGATGDTSGLQVKMQVFQVAGLPTAGNDVLTGTDGDDLFALQQGGNDTVDGRGGNDVFYMGTALSAGDGIDGGAGSDQVAVQGNYAGYTLGVGNLVNVETLAILSGTDTRFGDSGGHSYSYNLATVDASVAAGQQLIVQASDLRTGERLTFNGAAETNGSFLVYAGAGNDVLIGGNGNDTLDGGAGTDSLYGGGGNDTFKVDRQDDVVFENPNEGTDAVISTSNFYLYANIESLTLAAGAGNIFGVGNGLANVIAGNEGANTLLAGAGVDVVHGGAGVDIIYGEDGDDQLFGDADNDFLAGGLGDDVMDGGTGGDSVYGEGGNDTLTGGADFVFDKLVGGDGNDILRGDSGMADYDYLYGNAGDDSFYVDTGDDLTFEQAGEGTDTVYATVPGSNNGVYLYANIENLVLLGTTSFGVGNELANTMTGNASGNTLLGGEGNDTLNGKGGNDVLFGQGGSDTFVFAHGTGGDVIGDFVPGTDKIDLAAIGYSWTQVQNALHQNGGNTAIDLGNGDLVVLNGVTAAQLHQSDFILAGGSGALERDVFAVAIDPSTLSELPAIQGGLAWMHAPWDAAPMTMPLI